VAGGLVQTPESESQQPSACGDARQHFGLIQKEMIEEFDSRFFRGDVPQAPGPLDCCGAFLSTEDLSNA
jgi:hypothetical protein